jgi:DNA-directed RNA polymerase specialized sigma24 family protein
MAGRRECDAVAHLHSAFRLTRVHYVLPQPAPAQAAHRRRNRDAPWPPMDAVVRKLPAAHREILVATYFRRQTVEQVARQLGLTPAEAKFRLYHAMQELAAAVRATHPDPAGDTSRRAALSRT